MEPIVPVVLVIEISSSDSPASASEPHSVSDSFKSDPFKVTSTAASYVSRCGCASRSRWIITPIILQDVVIMYAVTKFSLRLV